MPFLELALLKHQTMTVLEREFNLHILTASSPHINPGMKLMQ